SGIELGRIGARDLGCRGRPGGGADDHLGGGGIQLAVTQTGDDADEPRVAGGTAAAENERAAGERRVCVHGSRLSRSLRTLPGATSSVADRALRGSTLCGYCGHG